jgi:hypothetical protein
MDGAGTTGVMVKGSNGKGSVRVECGIGEDKQSLKLRCDKCGFWENATEFLLKWSGKNEGVFGCLCATCKMKRRVDGAGRNIAVGKSTDEKYVKRLREKQRSAMADVRRVEGKMKKLKEERNLVMRESNNDRRYYELYAAKKDALAMEGKSMSRRLREAYFRRREAAFEARKRVAEIDARMAEIRFE